ncbi:endodeoxyribonuclease, partial [Escherichia coli]|uniref:RusA family crossover junction endodeoxyribonuclease n=1 Tax=Escherichia coli TaxID=562 RepID=UPI000B3F3E68
MRIEFVLPYPPTVNTYWRRRGSTYFVSKAGERYRRAVALIVRQQRRKLSLSASLAIKIIADRPERPPRHLTPPL